MSQISRPWTGVLTGDAGPYSARNWQDVWRYLLHGYRPNMGPIIDSGSAPNFGLQVQATSPASAAVDVLTGAAMVVGIFYENDATVTLSITANVSGNPRIDTVVLEADYTSQTVRLKVLTGTPAVTPAVPTLTQTIGTLYQIPIADIAVASGFVTIGNGDITSRHEWANAADGIYLKNVLNNSGVTLETGDVVVWDTSADLAVKLNTTFYAPAVAGVWVGRANNGDYGMVQRGGIGYIHVDAAYARGTGMSASNVSRRATGISGLQNGTLGVLLQASSGAGQRVLANINVQQRKNAGAVYANRQTTGTTGPNYASGLTTVVLNTEVHDEIAIGSLAANQMTMKAGVYYVSARAQLFSVGVRPFRLLLYNVTAASIVLEGSNGSTDASIITHAFLGGFITIYSSTVFELQMRVNGAPNAAVPAVNATEQESYAQIEWVRIDQ